MSKKNGNGEATYRMGLKALEQIAPVAPTKNPEQETTEQAEQSTDELAAFRESLATLPSVDELKQEIQASEDAWRNEYQEFVKNTAGATVQKWLVAREELMAAKPDWSDRRANLEELQEKLLQLLGTSSEELVGNQDPHDPDLLRLHDLIEALEPANLKGITAIEEKLETHEFERAHTAALESIQEIVAKGKIPPGDLAALKAAVATTTYALPQAQEIATTLVQDAFAAYNTFEQITGHAYRERHQLIREKKHTVSVQVKQLKGQFGEEQYFDYIHRVDELLHRRDRNKQAAITAARKELGNDTYEAFVQILEQSPLYGKKIAAADKKIRTLDAWGGELHESYSKAPSWTSFAAEQFTLAVIFNAPRRGELTQRKNRDAVEAMARAYRQTVEKEGWETTDWPAERKKMLRDLILQSWPTMDVFVPAKKTSSGDLGEMDLDSRTGLMLLDFMRFGHEAEHDVRDRLFKHQDKIPAGTSPDYSIVFNSSNIDGVSSPVAEEAWRSMRGGRKMRYVGIAASKIKLIFDHHADTSGKDVSAARYLYNTLKELGFFDTPEFKQNIFPQGQEGFPGDPQEALEKLLTFVDQEDNKTNEFWKKQPPGWWLEHGHHTVLGLTRDIRPIPLLRFFATHGPEDVTKPLSDQELRTMNLIEASEGVQFRQKNAKQIWSELEVDSRYSDYEYDHSAKHTLRRRDSMLLESSTYGRVIITSAGFPGGIDGVRAMAGEKAAYVIYNPNTNSFFVSTTGQELPENLFGVGKRTRESMWTFDSRTGAAIPSLEEITKVLGAKIPQYLEPIAADFGRVTHKVPKPSRVLGLRLGEVAPPQWTAAIAEQIKQFHITGTGVGAFSIAALDKEVKKTGNAQSPEILYREKAAHILAEALKPPAPRKPREPKPTPAAAAAPVEQPAPTPVEQVAATELETRLRAKVEQKLLEKFSATIKADNPRMPDALVEANAKFFVAENIEATLQKLLAKSKSS